MADIRGPIDGGSEHISTKENAAPHPLRRWWMVCLGTIAICAILFLAYRKHSSGKHVVTETDEELPHVTAVMAHKGDLGQYIEALGNVTPIATVNLYSQITGQVVAVHYQEGQFVHRGDALIDIDPAPYMAQLKEVQGTLEKDQALLRQAEMDMERYRKASSVDALARQTFEDQQLAVEQYRGTVKNDEGQVQYARTQLGYCHLTSPIDGRVGLRLVDRGNTIFSGSTTPLVVITQMQPVTVVFDVAEDYLSQIRSAITAHHLLPVDAYDRSQQNKIANGKLLTLDNQVDTSTGTVRLRSSFDNKDLALFPNQFVNARLLIGTLHNVVLVPSEAVQHNGTKSFVYVLADNAVVLRSVNEIGSEGLQTAVSGLEGNETVITSGFDRIQQGAKVVVQQPQMLGAVAQTKDSNRSSIGAQ